MTCLFTQIANGNYYNCDGEELQAGDVIVVGFTPLELFKWEGFLWVAFPGHSWYIAEHLISLGCHAYRKSEIQFAERNYA